MNINPAIQNHLVKILITSVFVTAVWFVSFAIFPENQVVKLDIGDPSPKTFIAPKYIEVEDIEATQNEKEAAEKLPQKQRTAFLLKHMQNLKIREISGIMGISEGTVKKYLFRAMEKLRIELKDYRHA